MNPSKRLVAFLIDLVAFGVPAYIAGFHHGEWVLGWILFDAVFVAGWQGRTPGKYKMGLKIVLAENKPVPFSKALVRSLGKILSTALFLIGDLWVFKDAKNKTWHDRWAGTLVVNDGE